MTGKTIWNKEGTQMMCVSEDRFALLYDDAAMMLFYNLDASVVRHLHLSTEVWSRHFGQYS